jgi:hypothetical protein
MSPVWSSTRTWAGSPGTATMATGATRSPTTVRTATSAAGVGRGVAVGRVVVEGAPVGATAALLVGAGVDEGAGVEGPHAATTVRVVRSRTTVAGEAARVRRCLVTRNLKVVSTDDGRTSLPDATGGPAVPVTIDRPPPQETT